MRRRRYFFIQPALWRSGPWSRIEERSWRCAGDGIYHTASSLIAGLGPGFRKDLPDAQETGKIVLKNVNWSRESLQTDRQVHWDGTGWKLCHSIGLNPLASLPLFLTNVAETCRKWSLGSKRNSTFLFFFIVHCYKFTAITLFFNFNIFYKFNT